jgi:dolichyl-phosphate-mannose-protein mannosyltransferase
MRDVPTRKVVLIGVSKYNLQWSRTKLKGKSGLRTEKRQWSWSDTIAMAAVSATAGVIRGIHLSRPEFIYSDELFYAREGCIYVYNSQLTCGIPLDAVSPHPPLGKWLISLGIRVFGWEPLGWRVAGLVAGTVTVALLYLLARRLLGSTWGATFTAGLLAIDFLHFVQSRIAMLDVYVTLFSVASFLFVVIDRDRLTDRGPEVRGRGFGALWRPWLLAAGLATGAAIATKWVGLGGLLGVAALSSVWALARPSAGRFYTKFQRALKREWPAMVLAFVVAPSLVYIVSYAPRIEGSAFALPWSHGSWIRNFASVQREMLNFHRHSKEILYVGKTNAYVSPAWSWPLIKRPMVYYSNEPAGDGHERITAMGSPLVWWTSLTALAYLGLQVVRRRRNDAAVVVLTGFAALYVPSLLMSSVRPATFVYYMLPSVPFMCLALATVAVGWIHSFPRWIVVGFLVVAVVLFAFFYPVLAGVPLSHEAVQARQWFHDCRPATGIAAPAGWCWQ